jgi:hypothetical protein
VSEIADGLIFPAIHRAGQTGGLTLDSGKINLIRFSVRSVSVSSAAHAFGGSLPAGAIAAGAFLGNVFGECGSYGGGGYGGDDNGFFHNNVCFVFCWFRTAPDGGPASGPRATPPIETLWRLQSGRWVKVDSLRPISHSEWDGKSPSENAIIFPVEISQIPRSRETAIGSSPSSRESIVVFGPWHSGRWRG